MKTVLLAIAACLLLIGAAPALTGEDHVVQITDKGFEPAKIAVKAGEKVVWKNATQKEHTVTASVKPAEPGQEAQEKPLFDSGPLKPGSSFEFTFTKEGTYEYGCTMDKGMTGAVVVKPAK